VLLAFLGELSFPQEPLIEVLQLLEALPTLLILLVSPQCGPPPRHGSSSKGLDRFFACRCDRTQQEGVHSVRELGRLDSAFGLEHIQ